MLWITQGGTGLEYTTKEDFLNEIASMIDKSIDHGGSWISIELFSDASVYEDEDEEDD